VMAQTSARQFLTRPAFARRTCLGRPSLPAGSCCGSLPFRNSLGIERIASRGLYSLRQKCFPTFPEWVSRKSEDRSDEQGVRSFAALPGLVGRSPPVPLNLSRKVTDLGDVHIVTLEGELDLLTGGGLADWLVALAVSTVVIDLQRVSFIDSAGIGALVRARNQLIAAGNDLVLSRPPSNIRRLFEVTGLSDWFREWDPTWSLSGAD
jgi:anti-sigma B factor antagonist